MKNTIRSGKLPTICGGVLDCGEGGPLFVCKREDFLQKRLFFLDIMIFLKKKFPFVGNALLIFLHILGRLESKSGRSQQSKEGDVGYVRTHDVEDHALKNALFGENGGDEKETKCFAQRAENTAPAMEMVW